jgi:deoxyribodipyrimidine photo-lyase
MSETIRFTDEDPRVRRLNAARVRTKSEGGEHVVYWCQMQRRPEDNAALAYAIEEANRLGVPCVVYEAIRPDYPYASDRLHAFVLEGIADMRAGLEARGVGYAFFLPRKKGDSRGVLKKLAARAALIVTDDYPTFVVATHLEKAAGIVDCALVAVDDCAVLPMALFPHEEYAARTIRPKVLRAQAEWLRPLHEPRVKHAATARLEWPFEPMPANADVAELLASCAIDHAVTPVTGEFPGGATAAHARLSGFVRRKLPGYIVDRNEPSRDGTSHLSPYLHWGMISARAVALAVDEAGRDAGVREQADSFLEQLLVRRGLAFNFARHNPQHATYAGIPDWAKKTLAEHAHDKRPELVPFEAMERAETPDPLWNASQRELLRRGIIQNYPRMLWGKIPMLWSSPEEAHRRVTVLNDKYALDGRDPDGYTNIAWCFGKHDRPWPERAIYGKVRTMTTRSAMSKLDFDDYVRGS